MSDWKKTLCRAFCTGVLVLTTGVILAVQSPVASAQPAPVTLGIIGNTVEYYPIFVADKEGFFEKNGIKVGHRRHRGQRTLAADECRPGNQYRKLVVARLRTRDRRRGGSQGRRG